MPQASERGDHRRIVDTNGGYLAVSYLTGLERVQEFDVQWGELVAQRSEAVARRRWHLMRACVPDARNLELPQMVRLPPHTAAHGAACDAQWLGRHCQQDMR